MKQKINKKKIPISIRLDNEIYNLINNTINNKSKFIVDCIIEELSKNNYYKKEIEKKIKQCQYLFLKKRKKKNNFI